MYKNYIKRFLDITVAIIGFSLLLPIFVLTSLFLLCANRGSVFFFQKRPGKDEQIFSILKFKTMNDFKDKDGNLLPDSVRLTAIGKFIRKTSLDEIPQLLNVIKGDMSLIGPRPLLVEYLSLYNKNQRRRHEVRPGITGWAQMNGRNTIPWEEKFKLDVWYVDHISLSLDFKIFCKTISKIFKSEGITSCTSVTMEKFEGDGNE